MLHLAQAWRWACTDCIELGAVLRGPRGAYSVRFALVLCPSSFGSRMCPVLG